MRRPMMRRNELPDFCFSTIPSSGQLIILRKGERGYYASEWDTGKREENQNIAREHNRRRDISDIQEAAMSAGSMFGWSLPGADPQWYLDNARYVNAIMAKGHIKDPVMSVYYPVDDFLLRYEVLGEAKMYLPVSALPTELMGAKSQFVMQPDLVCGVPAMPVKAWQAQNGSYTVELERGSYELDETAFPVTLNQNGQVLKVTRENKLITGSIEILKVDADTKQPLAGVVYRLFDADGNKIADGTTDTNGKVTFDNLKPGKYSYQEISTVAGYQLDDTKYDFSLTSENLTIKVTRENKPVKGCLTVRKVDVTGSPLAGAELLLETSVDGKNWTEVGKITTDKTGIAQWNDLKIGVQYRVTETKAPAGYTLMTEPLFTGTLDGDSPDVTITACNSAGFVLPFTGGTGFTSCFLFAALALMAGVYFCKKSARHEMAG